MHQILNLSNNAYEEIFKEIDISNLVEKKGIIYVWTNKNIKSRKFEIKVRDDLGIEQKLLNQKEVLDLEPELNPVFDAGVIYENSMHARDPQGILKQIFKLFIDRGGKFIKENVFVKGNYMERLEFSAGKFQFCLENLDDDLLRSILKEFDTMGFTLERVFREAGVNPLHFDYDELEYSKLIDTEDIITFQDLINT